MKIQFGRGKWTGKIMVGPTLSGCRVFGGMEVMSKRRLERYPQGLSTWINGYCSLRSSSEDQCNWQTLQTNFFFFFAYTSLLILPQLACWDLSVEHWPLEICARTWQLSMAWDFNIGKSHGPSVWGEVKKFLKWKTVLYRTVFHMTAAWNHREAETHFYFEEGWAKCWPTIHELKEGNLGLILSFLFMFVEGRNNTLHETQMDVF